MRESTGVSSALRDLPPGGGGVAPLGDRFQPDLLRGSGNFQIPLQLPYGPNQMKPGLTLVYSTGSGNGPFGLGWRINSVRIERRADRGVPRYDKNDQFVLGEGAVLVPVGDGRYRPETDNQGWMIERLSVGWRIRTGDGRTMLFGASEQARETNGGRDFAWCLEKETDPAGNEVEYHYRRDGDRLYLEEVRYSIFRLAFKFESRFDVLRNGRAGFLRTTRLRVTAIELHCNRENPTLIRCHRLTYANAANGASLLAKVAVEAEKDGETKTLPELRINYTDADLSCWELTEPTCWVRPPALGQAGAFMVDLTGDALPDILAGAGGRFLRWRNEGNGRLAGPEKLDGIPYQLDTLLPNVGFADLNGNGRVDLFAVDQPLQAACENNGAGGFDERPLIFETRPYLNLAAPHTRLTDVDGDGVSDLLSTERSHHLLFEYEPGVGWQYPHAVRRTNDLKFFPDVSLADRGVQLADMTGDGLQDIVFVQGGYFSYWPNLGRGKWGQRVEMESPPALPDGYHDDRLFLIDVDGSGCMDLVYVDFDRTIVWLNNSGAGFTAPVEIPVGAPNATAVMPVDIYGEGRPAIMWNAAPGSVEGAGYLALRLDPGQKPYLIAGIENGMGGIVEVEYSTSTQMRLTDREAGRIWTGYLPMVVPVVAAIRETDTTNGRVSEQSFHYHDPVYDGPQRDFCGFREVTVIKPGDDSMPTIRRDTFMFLGDPEHPDPQERARQRALAGAVTAVKHWEKIGDEFVLRAEAEKTWELRLEYDGGDHWVYLAYLKQIITREYGEDDPTLIDVVAYDEVDDYGNVGKRVRESYAEGDPAEKWIRSEERFFFVANEDAWLVKLPRRTEYRDGDGLPFAVQMRYYDGDPFAGLPEGEVATGLLTRVCELALLESRLPADYVGGRDFADWGLNLRETGDTRGWYKDSYSVQRDTYGNVVQQRDALGQTTSFVFDADALFPIQATDPLGNVVTLEFMPRAGEPKLTVMPDGRTVRNEFDALGRRRAMFETDANGVEQLVTSWYHETGQVPAYSTAISPADAGRQLTEFSNADPASLAKVSVSRVYYDGFGQESVTVKSGPQSVTGDRRFVATGFATLNTSGNVAKSFPPIFVDNLDFVPPPAVPKARQVRQRYDFKGQIIDTAGPGSTRFRSVRDSFHFKRYDGSASGPFSSDPPTGSPERIEYFDARGRLIGIVENISTAETVSTTYNLHVDGKIAAIRDDNDQLLAKWHQAGPGETIRVWHRDAGTRTYYYDAANNLRERINSDGSAIIYEYDAAGRAISVEHRSVTGETRTVRETIYDADPEVSSAGRFLQGRVAVVREGDVVLRYSYNPGGRPTRQEQICEGVALAAERRYDLQGRLTGLVYPDGSEVTYELDNGGYVTRVPGFIDQCERDVTGALTKYRCANGVEITQARDEETRRYSQISAKCGSNILRRLDYEYDEFGAISVIRDKRPGDTECQRFDYDDIHRLTGFTVTANDESGATIRRGGYTYDLEGNIQAISEAEPLQMHYNDPSHTGRLSQVQKNAAMLPLAYNGLGGVSAMGTLTSIEYDAFDRADRFTRNDGTHITLDYDHEDHIACKTIIRGGQIKRIHYLAGLFEKHETHHVLRLFLDNCEIAAVKVEEGGTPATAYYLNDHLGTIILATDQNGQVISNPRFGPFGSTWSPGAELHLFLGREWHDEIGLVHMGARFYSPMLGRFISPDWYVLENPRLAVSLPQAFNVYSYALNNPLILRDPTGKFIWLVIGVIVAVVKIALIAAAVAFAVGFVAGLIAGLVRGDGWESLLTGLETALTTTVGMFLGAITGSVLGPVGAIVGAVMGGLNGLISGAMEIYDWGDWSGWVAFLADSTWGLVGTSLGNIVHIINLFWPDSNYNYDLSHRKNRHVYEGGMRLKGGFAFTQGNVISNAGAVSPNVLENHEMFHVWQSRLFGPYFQYTYVAWAYVGFFVATIGWFTDTDKDWGDIMFSVCYLDNPFEYWAYKNAGQTWPRSGGDPDWQY
jgi:RHS repeat-associated protein